MTLGNDISVVSTVIDAVEAFGEENALPPKKIFQLNLVLDELITNTISYGYDDGAAGQIQLSVEFLDGTVNIELSDDGVEFNPVVAPSPELADSLEERQIGGLGLKLIRTYVNRLDYRRDGAFNRLHMEMDVV